jgi:hypothetical protein
MADELKSFEQTHWLRVYVAAEILAEETTRNAYPQRSFLTGWDQLTRRLKEVYLAKADARIIEFKQRYETLAG